MKRNQKADILKRILALVLAIVLVATSNGVTDIGTVLAAKSGESAKQSEAASQEKQKDNAAGTTKQSETAGETKQSETAGETKQSETTGETKQSETAGETKQSETAEETKQSETTGETKQSETTGETKQSETIGETKQSETTGETKQSETTGETKQSETAKKEKENKAVARDVDEVPLEVSTGIRINDQAEIIDGSGQITSGEEFRYQIHYTVPPLSSDTGGEYNNCSIRIPLDSRFEVIKDADSGKLAVEGPDVLDSKITGAGDARYLIINLTPTLVQNQARTINIPIVTSNFLFADGTRVNLNGTFEGSYQPKPVGSERPQAKDFSFDLNNAITIRAADDWQLTKTRTSDERPAAVTVDGKEYYEVTYKVDVANTEITDRNGRLALQNFILKDTLPTQVEVEVGGKTTTQNIPEDGKAVAITNVATGSRSLSEGTDYKVMQDAAGKVTGIEFYENSLDKVTESDKATYVELGSPKNTSYSYTVRYPKEAYISKVTEDLKTYTLTNTAQLKMTLLGKNEKTQDDTAYFKVGETESDFTKRDITIQKYVKVGEDSYLLNDGLQGAYGTARFGLYIDQECTRLASNVSNQKVEVQPVGTNGTVVFKDIRAGVYYLRETEVPNGFQGMSQNGIKLEIGENGSISIDSASAYEGALVIEGNTVKVTNISKDYGIVEFWKLGKDATGTIKALEGATFTLSDGTATYTAVSGQDGRVLFHGVKAGTYTLKETGVASSEYQIDGRPISVTVAANAITHPALTDEGSTADHPVFLNTSPYGRLEIRKESTDKITYPNALSGAEFSLYGPFSTEAEAKKADLSVQKPAETKVTTQNDGKAVSGNLRKGWYVIQETKAPLNHVLKKITEVVEVGTNGTAKATIENEPQAKFRFHKVGTANNTTVIEELAGVEFKLYEDQDGKNPLKDGEGKEIVLTTKLDATGKAYTEVVRLSPGTYYYKETKAPAPYTAQNTLVAFTVEDGKTDQVCEVTNYIEYAQIKIIKQDSKTGKNLSGAVFAVFESEEAAKAGTPVVDTITVQENGEGYSKLLPAGTYYIVETAAPEGYVAVSGIINGKDQNGVAITNGSGLKLEQETTLELTVKNDSTATIKIVKTDDFNQAKLQGAGFTLYTKSGNNYTPVGKEKLTDVNGVCSFSGLKPNTEYYYRETKAPSGYVQDTEYHQVLTYSADHETSLKEISVTNAHVGALKVNKTTTMDQEDGAVVPFSETVFNLYEKTADSFLDEKSLVTLGEKSPAAGQLSWENLKPGSYWLVETLPEGYYLESWLEPGFHGTLPEHILIKEGVAYKVWPVEVSSWDNCDGQWKSTDVKNDPVKGRVQIAKKNLEGQKVKATFTLTKVGETKPSAVLSTNTTDGSVVSGWLDPGQYILKEIDVETGYVLDPTEYTVMVVAGKTTTEGWKGIAKQNLLEITNAKQNSLTIKKYEAYQVYNADGTIKDGATSRSPLKGAKFGLYLKSDYPDADVDTITKAVDGKKANYTFDMTDEAELTVKEIVPDDYWLIETVTPSGYKTVEPQVIKVLDGTKNAQSISVDNESSKPRIRIHKTEQGTAIEIAGANFEVYRVDPAGTETTIKRKGQPATSKSLVLVGTYQTGTTTKPDGSGQQSKGDATTILLPTDKEEEYYIKEIDGDNKAFASRYYFDKENPWSGPIVIPANSTGEFTINIENYKKATAPGQKVDSSGNLIRSAETYLGVFRDQSAADAMAAVLASDYDEAVEKASAANGQKYRLTADMLTTDFMAAHQIDQIVQSKSDGTFQFQNLIPGETYYILELVAPTGYSLEKANGSYVVHSAVIGDDGKFASIDGDSSKHSLVILDWEKRQIWISKQAVLSGEAFRITEGVEFTIYASKMENGQDVIDETKPVDVIKSVNSDGTYISILLPPGVYFIKETKTPDGFIGMTEAVKVILTSEKDNKDWYIGQDGKGNAIVNVAQKGIFYLDKRNSLTNAFVKANFKLDKWDGTTFKEVGIISTTGTTYVSTYLEPGIYRLDEISVTGNFTIVSEPIYLKIEANKITDAQSGTKQEQVGGSAYDVYQPRTEDVSQTEKINPLTVLNVPQGFIRVLKKGIWNGDGAVKQEEVNLNGVKFEIYKDANNLHEQKDVTLDKIKANGNTSIANITTNKNGVANSKGLDAGWYWLVETNVGAANQAEYGKDSYAPIPVQVIAGKTVNNAAVTRVENVSNYGKFRVKKIDADTKEALTGAVFEIGTMKDGSFQSLSKTMTANGNGIYTSPKLPAGTYYLKETTAPNGYLINEDPISGPYVVTENGFLDATAQAIENELACTINVVKEDSKGQTITASPATFGLYASKEEAKSAKATAPGNYVQKADTQDGKITFANLKSGTYWLKELAAPGTYVLSEQVYEIKVSNDIKDGKREALTVIQKVANMQKGRFKIKKQSKWMVGSEDQTQNLDKVTFKVYQYVEGEDTDSYYSDKQVITTVTTNAKGEAESGYLDAGKYILIETVPDGYAKKGDSPVITVTEETVNTEYFDNPIFNIGVKGKFRLFKTDSAGKDLTGATFYVEKQTPDGSWERLISGDIDYITVDHFKDYATGKDLNGYESGMLDVGTYRVIERTAPTTTVVNGLEAEYVVDPEPIEFQVTAETTVGVTAINSPKLYLQVVKTSDHETGEDGSPKLLAGAKFQLYQYDENGEAVENPEDLTDVTEIRKHKGQAVGQELTTGEDGRCQWDKLEPGTYVLEEILAPEGYETTAKVVVIPEGRTENNLKVELPITDQSNMGRILIRKLDKDGNAICTPENGLTAKFEIFAKATDGSYTDKVDTVTVNNEAGVYTKLLPAAKEGTAYKVVETAAPEGYTLDDTFYKLEMMVTVKPVHWPEYTPGTESFQDAFTEGNVVTFINKKTSDIGGFQGALNKTVSLDGGVNYSRDVETDTSILSGDLTVDFKVDGLNDGTNEIGANTFQVTDEKIILQALEEGLYTDVPATELKDYTIHSVTVLPARNEAGPAVGATVLVKKAGTQDWAEAETIADLSKIGSEGQKVTLDGMVRGIRINYTNVEKGFTADGFTMNVTFFNRAEWSDSTLGDIRKIVNTAELTWLDQSKDENGNLKPQGPAEPLTSTATITLPDYDQEIPEVALTYEIPDKSPFYYVGQNIPYKVTGTNTHDSANLKQPIMSVTLPANTTLNESFDENKFRIYRKSSGSRLDFDMETVKTTEDGKETTQYVFTFGDFELPPGESIIIEYEALISENISENTLTLTSNAYIGSNYVLPKTKDNPYGTSFTTIAGGTDVVTNPDIDGTLSPDTELEYLNSPETVRLSRADGLTVVKTIGVENTDGQVEWLNAGQTAHVNPTDRLYYTLTLNNYAADKVKTARFVDILPFNGDTYEMTGVARDTTIPTDGMKEKVQLIEASVSADERVESYKIYYYHDAAGTNSFAEGTRGDVASQIPGLFKTASSWPGGWSEDAGDLSTVTAVGYEITFKDGNLLKQNESYSVGLTVSTPGYTAEQIEDYAGKQIANSTAVSVVREYNTTENIPTSDRAQSSQVFAQLNLPTGTIGDYMWYDSNGNGIQDDGEEGVANRKVTLKTTKVTAQGISEEMAPQYTSTSGDVASGKIGYYEFTNLPCNYLKRDYDKELYATNPADPSLYVGNTYYSYQVTFSVPDGYSATTQYANGTANKNNEEKDSNIDLNGQTEVVTLNVIQTESGGRYVLSGEKNMTIDAGIIQPVKLGDYVWLDKNKDGIQGPDEQGVNGALVYLYKVDGPDAQVGAMQTPYRVQKTHTNNNRDGYYCFEQLPKGYYVVQFDVSDLTTDGYTYQYAFTQNINSATDLDNRGDDSDARYDVNGNDRIKRTNVINLQADDMTWDAGLTYYSALGGYCFDDMDYDNEQSLYIALPGTEVYLYRVKNNIREEAPIRSVVVGEDGRYFFDHLDAGDYQIYFKYPENYAGCEPGHGTVTTDSETAIFDDASRNAGFTQIITLGENTVDTTHDAGAYLLSAIGDYVWFDANRNGIQDAGEVPVPGITVTLQTKTGDGEWTTYQTAITDEKGKYLFEGLKSSKYYDVVYRVVFHFQEKQKVTISNVGKDSAVDSDALSVKVQGLGNITNSIKPGYGMTDLTWDAGIYELSGAVGDYVWYDTNKNGIQDADEKGVANIRVVLLTSPSGNVDDKASWTVVGETTTNASGYYLFEDLPAGYYRVKFLIPSQYTATLANRGKGSDAYQKDSDGSITYSGESGWYYSRSFYLNEGDVDLTWDAGLYTPEQTTKKKTVIKRVKKPTTNRTVTRTTTRTTTRTNNRSTTRRSSRTGDDSRYIIWLAVLLLSGTSGIYLTRRKKRKES